MIKKILNAIALKILERAATEAKEKIKRLLYVLEERAKKTPNEVDDKIIQILRDLINA